MALRFATTRLASVGVALLLGLPIPAFGQTQPSAREAAYRSILGAEAERAVDAALVAALQSADPSIAQRAALGLGRTRTAAAYAPLLAAWATDSGTRAMIVYALGLLANVRQAEAEHARAAAVVERALADTASGVRLAACDSVDRFGAAARLPSAPVGELGRLFTRFARVLESLVAHDPDARVRSRAALALATFAGAPGAKEVAGALGRAVLADPDTDVRRHAAWSLSRAFAKEVATSTVIDGASDADEVVRIQFARLIGRRNDAKLGRELTLLARDPSWRVQEQAREAQRLLAKETPTDHLTAIPRGVRTPNPSPIPDAQASALPRPAATGGPAKPTVARANVAIPLRLDTAASLLGPSAGPHPRVRITTSQGAIVVRLFPEWAPLTVENFLDLTDRGYFDGLRWFRIVPDFVVQTGDPKDDGEGDAGYQILAEENPLEQSSGTLSMGLNYDKAGPQRDSAGTQFYIDLSPQYHLDRDFTVFGRVEAGFDVLGRLTESDRMLKVERIADR